MLFIFLAKTTIFRSCRSGSVTWVGSRGVGCRLAKTCVRSLFRQSHALSDMGHGLIDVSFLASCGTQQCTTVLFRIAIRSIEPRCYVCDAHPLPGSLRARVQDTPRHPSLPFQACSVSGLAFLKIFTVLRTGDFEKRQVCATTFLTLVQLRRRCSWFPEDSMNC